MAPWLRAAGHECTAVATPKAALKALAAEPAQLILVGGDDPAAGCRVLRDDARLGEAWLLAVTDRDDNRIRGGRAPGGRRRLPPAPVQPHRLLARARAGPAAAEQRSTTALCAR